MRSKQEENEYQKYLDKLKGGCPFCPVPSDNKLKAEYRYWKVIHNKFPHENTEKSYVIILKRHLDNDKRKDLSNNNQLIIFIAI